jgi:hypothetical protein
MDPYLEAHWRDVHTSLMIYVRDQLQSQLPSDLMARVEESVTVDEDDRQRTIYPDVRMIEEHEPSSTAFEASPAAVAVAEPLLIKREDEAPTDRHVEILDAHGRIVTAIEIISPTNKADFDSRNLYRRKQREYLKSGINLVEIDLIRGGEHVLAVSLEHVKKPLPPYLICVRRAIEPDLSVVYGAALQERLPVVPIPLRATDRDVALDLQELIETCYERGRYASLDYRRPLNPPLAPEDAAWVAELLQERKSSHNR